jgi:hypothetical protein
MRNINTNFNSPKICKLLFWSFLDRLFFLPGMHSIPPSPSRPSTVAAFAELMDCIAKNQINKNICKIGKYFGIDDFI